MRAPLKKKKLGKGEFVEVRQNEEGLRGAWHEGVVIDCPCFHRKVKYKHLFDDNSEDALVESVKVSSLVDGLKNEDDSDRNKLKKRGYIRGYIRPLPPPLNTERKLSYGLCVEALYDDAWWEGIIYDNAENSPKRAVFFPDEGDELMIPKENLRVTQDWDESRGRWRVRGYWVLANLSGLCDSRGFSVKVVWYNLRTHRDFLGKVGEWMYGKKNDWIDCLAKVFKLLEREPSRQLIPGLVALGAQRLLNGEESFPSGSLEWKNSSQSKKSNLTHPSSLDEDSNKGAIVCCETVGQVWPLDAIVVEDTVVHSENANELIERIENGFCDSLESSSRENCSGKELSKVLRTNSHAYRRRSPRESLKAIGADVNEPASLGYGKGKSLVKGMEQQNTKQQGRHIGKELYRDAAIGANLMDRPKRNRNQSVKSPRTEAHLKGQTECIDMLLLKTSTRNQFNAKNGTKKLSPQVSAQCKSLSLAAGGKLLEKFNEGHRSPSTYRPSASFNSEDYLEAVLKYDAFSYSSKEIKAKAKIYLLQEGWRLEVKCRTNSERQDMHYISPKGNIYYSLLQACSAWREEHKVEIMTDSEDVWVKGSTSPSSQEPLIRVKRKTLSSVAKFPKRSWRIDTSQQLPTIYSNDDAFKFNNRSSQLVSWSKRLRCDRNKKRSVTCEGPSVSELTHVRRTCNFLSNSIAPDFESRNTSGEESNSKGYRQPPLPVCGWRSKKRKLNVEGSMDFQNQTEAKSICHVWNRKGTPANWHRMPELPSTLGKSNDSTSFQDNSTGIFNLSWLIENGVVAKNQQVFFMYGKEGWITSEGILCACCCRLYSLTSFEAHAGSKLHPFSVNLRLDDGRSLAQCQMQALRKKMRVSSEDKRMSAPSKENKKQAPLNKKLKTDILEQHDDFCFVCRKNGKVTLCDSCTRSFHEECVSPEKMPGTEEWTKWFCPNCRCNKCGGGEFSDDENFTENTVLFCDQCECLFHVGCLDSIGMSELASCPKGNWFCSQKCSEIFSQLRNLVGKANPLGDGLSWTLLRSTEEDRDPSRDEIIAEEGSDPLFDKVLTKRKLSAAMSVMHESFSRITEYRTRLDYVEEIIFNRGCERNLLKFQGFYTAILEKGNKLVSVATMRIHGKRGAELPLIATRTQYRRKGMCRLLLNEIEKLLNSLHIEKIVLPAIYQLESTWKESFGFQKMTSEEMFDLLKLDIVHFPDTTMLQKILMGANPEQEILTEIDDSKNRAEGMDQSRGNIYGLEIQEGIFCENPEISACHIRPYSEYAESVIPLCSLPGKTNSYVKPHSNSGEGGRFNGKLQSLSKGYRHSGSALRRRCRIRKNNTEKIECHSGKTPMEDDVDESSVVIMGTTRSNRLVKQVKRKVGYSCHWEEHKPMRSVEHYLDRKINKKTIKERIIASDKLLAVPPADALESSQKKDIQFGTCEIRKSIVCRTNSGIADDNCFSKIKADDSILDRPVLEHGSDHVAVNRENVSGKIIASDKLPAIPPAADALESSQEKDIQFGTCEIRKSIVCRTDDNCFSNIKADESVLERSVPEHGSDDVVNGENVSGKIIASDKLPAIPPADALESSQKKDTQFGTCGIRKSIVCRTNSGIAYDNCFSNIKADESVLDRSVPVHESDHVAVNRENVSGTSHVVNCNENFRENHCGHLGAQYSFKYVYTRRRKQICS